MDRKKRAGKLEDVTRNGILLVMGAMVLEISHPVFAVPTEHSVSDRRLVCVAATYEGHANSGFAGAVSNALRDVKATTPFYIETDQELLRRGKCTDLVNADFGPEYMAVRIVNLGDPYVERTGSYVWKSVGVSSHYLIRDGVGPLLLAYLRDVTRAPRERNAPEPIVAITENKPTQQREGRATQVETGGNQADEDRLVVAGKQAAEEGMRTTDISELERKGPDGSIGQHPKELSDEEKEKLYRDGIDAIHRGDNQEALRLLEALERSDQIFRDLSWLLARLRTGQLGDASERPAEGPEAESQSAAEPPSSPPSSPTTAFPEPWETILLVSASGLGILIIVRWFQIAHGGHREYDASVRGATLTPPEVPIAFDPPSEPDSLPNGSDHTVIDWIDETTVPPAQEFSLGGLDLIGREDPVDGTPLRAGERIAVCLNCRTGYHEESWAFLVAENNNQCVSCRTIARAQLTVPQSSVQAWEMESAEIISCPSCRRRNRVAPGGPKSLAICGICSQRLFPQYRDTSAPPLVRLSDVRNYVGSVVLFEGEVCESFATRSGTYFVKFERGMAKNVFKLVIFKQYAPSFHRAGFQIESYRGRTIRVRGLVQVHPQWGVEILVNDPSVIQIIQ